MSPRPTASSGAAGHPARGEVNVRVAQIEYRNLPGRDIAARNGGKLARADHRQLENQGEWIADQAEIIGEALVGATGLKRERQCLTQILGQGRRGQTIQRKRAFRGQRRNAQGTLQGQPSPTAIKAMRKLRERMPSPLPDRAAVAPNPARPDHMAISVASAPV